MSRKTVLTPCRRRQMFVFLCTVLLLSCFVTLLPRDTLPTGHVSSISRVGQRGSMRKEESVRDPRPVRVLIEPDSKIGFLSEADKDGKILPLFSWRSPHRRFRYHYYTQSDTFQFSSVKLPVEYRGRTCTDELGCDEVYSGDTVRVQGYNRVFAVTLY